MKLDIVRELSLVSRYGSLYNKVSVINAESLVYVKILVSVQACMIDNDKFILYCIMYFGGHIKSITQKVIPFLYLRRYCRPLCVQLSMRDVNKTKHVMHFMPLVMNFRRGND